MKKKIGTVLYLILMSSVVLMIIAIIFMRPPPLWLRISNLIGCVILICCGVGSLGFQIKLNYTSSRFKKNISGE